MKIKVNLLFFLSLLIAAVGFCMFFLLFVKGEELLPKDYVFVPKEGEIATYTDITPDNFRELFELKEVLRASITPSMVTLDNMQEVFDKTLVTPLHKDEFLTLYHVSDPILVPEEGEMAYPIPDDWWEVIDWTGRIGDVGEIWLTPAEPLRKWYEQKEQNATLSTIVNPTDTIDNQEMQPMSYQVVPDLPNRPLSKPLFKNVRVRYVFDSSNRQIRNAKGIEDRSEGTGRPENVKMYLSEEKYSTLKQAVEEGYKLILAVNNEVDSR